MAATLAVLCAAPAAQGQVFRWDNGALIAGTDGIPPAPGANFSGLDLSVANLVGKDLTSASFAGAALLTARLSSSTLASANFGGANLTSANFTFSSLSSASFAGATVAAANLSGATSRGFTAAQLYSTASYAARSLAGINLGSDDLSGWDLASQDLASATFSYSSGTSLGLSGASLSHVTFVNTVFPSANFSGARLANAGFISPTLAGATFAGADMTLDYVGNAAARGANFSGANLTSAYLTLGDFTSASFASATFLGQAGLNSSTLVAADFRGANLTSAVINYSNLTSASFASANLAHCAFVSDTLSATDFRGGDLTGAFLMSQVLASCDFSGANLAGAFLILSNLATADFSLADLRRAGGYAPAASTIVRGAILPNGTIGAFGFRPGEVLRVRPNATPASALGAIDGPGTIQVDAGGSLAALGATVARISAAGTLSFGGVQPTPITTSELDVTGAGFVDMSGNDMVVGATPEATVEAMVARWYVAGGGSHPGLGSRLATASSLTTLGVIANSDGAGGALYGSFDGVPVSATDVLVKYTYVGDANLDGVVDGQDLSNLLAGVSGGLTGWGNGDANYDGVVDGNDLSLLLAALAGQGAPLTGPGGSGGAVPEPSSLAPTLGIAAGFARRPRPSRRALPG